MTSYEVLGIDPAAAETDIKKAFHGKAAKLHPDISSAENATETMATLNTAYEECLAALATPKTTAPPKNIWTDWLGI